MPAVRWICISDLHLGALNSVLTSVQPDGEHVDQSSTSPVTAALCDGLRSLSEGHEPPQLIVAGDLFELALSSTDDAAATFAQFVGCLRPGSRRRRVAAHPVHAGQPRPSSVEPGPERLLPRVPGRVPAEPTAAARSPTYPPASRQRTRDRPRPVRRVVGRTGRDWRHRSRSSRAIPNLGLVTHRVGGWSWSPMATSSSPCTGAMSPLDDVVRQRRPTRSPAAGGREWRVDRLLLVVDGGQWRRRGCPQPV